MRFLGSLILLAAAAAHAQALVGPEVVWRTTSLEPTFHPAPQAAPIAPDRGGYVVAWSEVEEGVSRAYAGRLDGFGRLVTVGVRTSGTADAVAIVPFGDRYIAAWLEPGNDGRPLLISGALDRSFALLSAHAMGLTPGDADCPWDGFARVRFVIRIAAL